MMELTDSDMTEPFSNSNPLDVLIDDSDYDAIVNGDTNNTTPARKYRDMGKNLQGKIESIINEFSFPDKVRTMISEKLSEAIVTNIDTTA
jgi:hypothetical protein